MSLGYCSCFVVAIVFDALLDGVVIIRSLRGCDTKVMSNIPAGRVDGVCKLT